MDETVNPEPGNESPQEPFNAEAAFDAYLQRQAQGDSNVDATQQPDKPGADDDQPGDLAKPDDTPPADPNEQRYKVKVNGEEREVPISELVKGYQLEADYRVKTSQVAEQARAAQAQFAQAQAVQQHYAQQLQQYQAQLAQMQPQQPDPALIDADPVRYLRQQQAWQSWQGQMQRTQAEAQQLAAQQAAQQQHFSSQHLAQQAELLAKAQAEFADPEKAKTVKAELAKYLQKTGYSADEVASVADHRAVVMARKAMLYDKMMEKQTQASNKLQNLPPRAPQRPGSGSVSSNDGRTKAMQDLKRTGSLDSAAKAFASMLGAR